MLAGEDNTQLCGTVATECSDCQPRVDCNSEMALCLDREGTNEETQVGPPNPQDVQGRIKTNIVFWREVLKAPGYVLDWIESGYKLPLQYLPEAFYRENHSSVLAHHQFVTDTVAELLGNRCISKTPQRPHVCSPLSVAANAEGKLRLVLNLRYLNQFLHKVKFKYEDLRVALLMLIKEDFLIKFDLKSGYHHFDIFEPHQEYLDFSWGLGEDFGYFVFNVLPFGLATACYVFTKLMRFWRGWSKGYPVPT